MDRVHVIANPNAAGGKGGRLLPRLEERFRQAGRSYRLAATRAPGHARDLAAEILQEEEPGPILVVGGDGTVHEVANGLLAFPDRWANPMAVLPVGTGNDFYRMVRAGGTLGDVMAVLASGTPRAFDVGRARWAGGEGYFVNLLGVGIDVEVLRVRSRFQRLPGLLQYLAAFVSAAARYEPVPLEIAWTGDGADEVPLRASALLSAVTIGPTVGGGFRLAPDARPDDGLLDLFFAEAMGPLEIARELPRVIRGTHRETERIHLRTFRGGRIVSTEDQPFHFELDGELMAHPTSWIDIDTVPGALLVLDRTNGERG